MQDNKDFWQAMIQAMLMRSVGTAASESTIEERWSDIIASRFSVRVRQYLGAIVGGLVGFLGLLFVGLPLGLSGAVSTWGDWLVIGCFATLAVMMFWGGVEVSMKAYAPRRRAVVTGMGGTVVLAAIALASLRFGKPEWWHPLAIVVGLCIFGPSVAFVFNQITDLLDPLGWVSAFERQIAPILTNLLGQQATTPQIVERPLFPWRHGNREQMVSAKREGDGDNRIDVPAQDDLTLADFLLEATRRPLGRDRHWLGRGKVYTCPTTGVKVTRPTYDKMIGMMERLGYIERGGDGEATQWLTEPQAAYDDWCQRLEDEWGDLLGGDDG